MFRGVWVAASASHIDAWRSTHEEAQQVYSFSAPLPGMCNMEAHLGRRAARPAHCSRTAAACASPLVRTCCALAGPCPASRCQPAWRPTRRSWYSS